MYRYRVGRERWNRASEQPLRVRIFVRSWKRYFRMSGSNRVPLRPKRATDKHSIGFNPVGRINLAVPEGGGEGDGSESFSSETTAAARLRNRSGAHGSLNDTAPIFTRPDSRPTTARFDRTGFKFVGGSATRSLPCKFFSLFLPLLSSPLHAEKCKNSLDRENDRFDSTKNCCVRSKFGKFFLSFQDERYFLKFFVTLGVSFPLMGTKRF